ncbi:MAG: hypothetical protein SVK44_02525, partial [Nitrospirota bacterium]|nr:hypothetical protein [Nitrospirota bacterium]
DRRDILVPLFQGIAISPGHSAGPGKTRLSDGKCHNTDRRDILVPLFQGIAISPGHSAGPGKTRLSDGKIGGTFLSRFSRALPFRRAFAPGLERPGYRMGSSFRRAWKFPSGLPFRRAWKDPAIGWEDRRDILVPHLQGIAISPGPDRRDILVPRSFRRAWKFPSGLPFRRAWKDPAIGCFGGSFSAGGVCCGRGEKSVP